MIIEDGTLRTLEVRQTFLSVPVSVQGVWRAGMDFSFIIFEFSPKSRSMRRLERALVPRPARGGQVRFLNDALLL
jgi:hypothetical protein